MKRIVLSLSAAAVVLMLAATVYADDTQSSAPATKPSATEARPTPMHHHSGGKHSSVAAVDLNSCTKEQLMALPGIDDATADKIIAARPFAMRGELLKKSLVSKAEYSKIRSHVMAKKSS